MWGGRLFSPTHAEGQRQLSSFSGSNSGFDASAGFSTVAHTGSWRTAVSVKMLAQEVLFFEGLCGHLVTGEN